jgi:hypothetical protein
MRVANIAILSENNRLLPKLNPISPIHEINKEKTVSALVPSKCSSGTNNAAEAISKNGILNG